MNLSEIYPRRFASGSDLVNSIIVTVSAVTIESMYSGNGQTVEKPVLYFKETKKGVVLCKTLAYQIADILGSTDTSTWIGQQITLVPDTMMVAGKPRNVIRARKVDLPTFSISPSPVGEGRGEGTPSPLGEGWVEGSPSPIQGEGRGEGLEGRDEGSQVEVQPEAVG